MRNGKGKYTFSDGTIYDGNWKNDIMHGDGMLYLTDKTIIEATWENGYRHGKGTITDADGKKSKVEYYKDLEVRESN